MELTRVGYSLASWYFCNHTALFSPPAHTWNPKFRNISREHNLTEHSTKLILCPVYQCYYGTSEEHFNDTYSVNSLLVIGTLKDLQRAVVKWEDAGRHNCSLHHIWRAISVVILSNVEVLTDAARGETI